MALNMDLQELKWLLQFVYLQVESTALLPQPSIRWLDDTNVNLRAAYRAVARNLDAITEESIDTTFDWYNLHVELFP